MSRLLRCLTSEAWELQPIAPSPYLLQQAVDYDLSSQLVRLRASLLWLVCVNF
jgi:hypothetical protein